MSIKTILLPTDFSEAADNALGYATGIALAHGAKIVLLHSIEMDYKTALYDQAVAASEPFRKEALARILALKHVLLEKGVDTDHVISEHALVDMVLHESADLKADLIIMGTAGARGIKKMTGGSNAGRIVEQADCPVLVIAEKTRYRKISKAAYATDYQDADESAIGRTIDIIRPYKALLKILHFAADVSRSEGDQMLSFIQKINSKVSYPHISYEVINLKKNTDAIEAYFSPDCCDLLVVSTRQRYLIQKLFDESLPMTLVSHSQLPLLVFHHALKPVLL